MYSGEIKRTEPCELQNSVLELNKSNFLGRSILLSSYHFGIDEKKIRLEITTKKGFELSKEVENFKWAEQH